MRFQVGTTTLTTTSKTVVWHDQPARVVIALAGRVAGPGNRFPIHIIAAGDSFCSAFDNALITYFEGLDDDARAYHLDVDPDDDRNIHLDGIGLVWFDLDCDLMTVCLADKD